MTGGGEDDTVIREVESVIDSSATHNYAVTAHRVNTPYDEIVVYSDEISKRPSRGDKIKISFDDNDEPSGVRGRQESLRAVKEEIEDRIEFLEEDLHDMERAAALRWVVDELLGEVDDL